MKRYGSIWMLAAQNTLWKLLLIWALTFLAEFGLLVLAMGAAGLLGGTGISGFGESRGPRRGGRASGPPAGCSPSTGVTALPAAAGIPCAGSVWTSGR